VTTAEITAKITKYKQMIEGAEAALDKTITDAVASATFHTGTYGAYQSFKNLTPKEILETIESLESAVARLTRTLTRSGIIQIKPRRYH